MRLLCLWKKTESKGHQTKVHFERTALTINKMPLINVSSLLV